MSDEITSINLWDEIQGLFDCLNRGDPYASVHLARLVQADAGGALRPFAEALAARLCDHLNRHAEVGVNDPYVALEDEVYDLIQKAAVDWDKIPRTGRPGEETLRPA
jgi:hypothetical protein